MRIFYLLPVALFLVACSPKTEPKMVVSQITASSQLNGADRPTDFSPWYLLDGNGASSWCSDDSENGLKSKIVIKLAKPISFNRIYLQNGYNSAVTQKGKIDDVASLKNYKTRAAVAAVKVTVKYKDKVHGEALLSKIPDQPKSTLQLEKNLVGDVIELQISDFHVSARPNWAKGNTCITGLAFGTGDEKQDGNLYPISFVFGEAAIEQNWGDFYEKILKDEYAYLKTNAWFARCLSQPKESNKMTLSTLAISPEGGFNFLWERPDISPLAGTLVFRESAAEDENAIFNYYRLKPQVHTSEYGLEYGVFEPASEQQIGRLTIRWVKKSDLDLNTLADDPEKKNWHYLLETSSEIEGLDHPIINQYILSQAK